MIEPMGRALRRRAITAATPALALVLLQLLVGCGGDAPIGKSTDVEQNTTAYLRSQAGRPIERVNCPGRQTCCCTVTWRTPTSSPASPRPSRSARRAFAALFGAKYPKAVAKVVDDREQLLAFYDFPAEHWRHLKTSNPIESTFATVRLRTRVTKGPGSRAAGLAMVFKLLQAAQEHWRHVNGAHLVALVRAGATFEKGVLVERPEQAATKDAA